MTPLGKFFAVCHPDGHERMAWRERLSPFFESIVTVDSGWVVASGGVGTGPGPLWSGQDVLILDLTTASREQVGDWMRSDGQAENFDAIPGDVTAVRFEGEGATAWRSVSGRVPVHWHRNTNGLFITSQLRLFRQLVSDEIDPFGLAAWVMAGQVLPGGRTPVRGLRCLEPGGFVTLRPHAPPRLGAYWSFEDIDDRDGRDPDTRRAHEAELRAALIEAIRADASPSGNLVSLSGGVDSSSLTALLVNTVGCAASAFSLLPADPDDYCSQRRFLDALRSEVQLVNHLEVRYGDLEWAAASSVWSGSGISVPHPVLAHLPTVQEMQPVEVLFGGEFADQIVGWRPGMPDWFRSVPTREMVWRLRRPGLAPGGRRFVVRAWLRELVRGGRSGSVPTIPDDLPSFVQSDIRAEYRSWRRDLAATLSTIGHRRRSLHVDLVDRGSIIQNWEVCSALDVRRAYPFLSRRVIELSARCHPDELIGTGTKGLLRRSLAGLVPGTCLNRTDSGTWGAPTLARFPRRFALPRSAAGVVRPEWMSVEPGECSLDDAYALVEIGLALSEPSDLGEWDLGEVPRPLRVV